MSEHRPERMSKVMPEDLSERRSQDMTRQKIYQKECQKIWYVQRLVQSVCVMRTFIWTHLTFTWIFFGLLGWVRRSAQQSATRPCCGLLRSSVFSLCSSQYLPSRVSPPIRYGWYCGWWRCSKVPVSSPFFGSPLDSPFFVLWQFLCWAPSLLAAVVSPCPRSLRFSWLFVVICGTGWASTLIVNLWPPFHLCWLTGYFNCSPYNIVHVNFHQV